MKEFAHRIKFILALHVVLNEFDIVDGFFQLEGILAAVSSVQQEVAAVAVRVERGREI